MLDAQKRVGSEPASPGGALTSDDDALCVADKDGDLYGAPWLDDSILVCHLSKRQAPVEHKSWALLEVASSRVERLSCVILEQTGSGSARGWLLMLSLLSFRTAIKEITMHSKVMAGE